MSEEKQNGDQQPSVEVKTEVIFHEYIVCDRIKEIDDKSYYELISQDSNIKVKILYIEVSKVVLAPNMIISILYGKLNDGEILYIKEFDETTCLRLKEKHKVCLFKSSIFQILFPDEVKELNYLYSGVVMKNMNSVVEVDRKLFLYKPYAAKVYEVKLDSKISIKSIDRVFKKIYLYSDNGILNGFKVEKLKIDAESLFDCNHNSTINKPELRVKFSKKDDILSKDDMWLLKKSSFYKNFNSFVKNLSLFIISVVVGLNIFMTSSYFAFSLASIASLVITIFIYLSFSNKVNKIYNLDLIKKDDIYKVFSTGNIKGTIFSFLFILLFLHSYSVIYKYKTDYVYDSIKQEFLDSNEFIVNRSLVFRKNKILDIYVPVINNYSIDLLYQNPNSLLTFSNKFIDLEINIEFKEGKFLLGDDMSKNLLKIKTIFQENISKGLYGDLSTMNTYEYRKVLIDIEQDIMNLLTVSLRPKKLIAEDIVDKITITTKYAKLQNVD